MRMDRRTFVTSVMGAFAAATVRAKSIEDRGLFWTATPEGKRPSILFGYARMAASVAGDIVADGRKYTLQSGMLLGDVPNIKLPPVKMDLDESTPIANRVPPELAQRIRAYLAQNFTKMPAAEKLTGFGLAFVMQGEGQTPPQPSVGGVIAEEAQKAGRPVAFLLTPKEYAEGYKTPDPGAVDKRVTAEVIGGLFKLRDAVGPIGKHQEALYVARRVGELEEFADKLKALGAPTMADISGLPVGQLDKRIIQKAVDAVQTAKAPLFLMIPVGSLTEPDGVIAKLREARVVVKSLA